MRSLILAVTLLVSLVSMGPVPLAQVTLAASPPYVAAAAQDFAPLAGSSLTIEQVREAFVSAGFQVDEPITWNWTSPPVNTFRVHDAAQGRDLTVLVYPSATAAQAGRLQAEAHEQAFDPGRVPARDRGPHLVSGYGESVWLGNVAMVETARSGLDRLDQILIDRDLGVYVDPELIQATSQPRFAVEQDFLQALTNSVVNL